MTGSEGEDEPADKAENDGARDIAVEAAKAAEALPDVDSAVKEAEVAAEAKEAEVAAEAKKAETAAAEAKEAEVAAEAKKAETAAAEAAAAASEKAEAGRKEAELASKAEAVKTKSEDARQATEEDADEEHEEDDITNGYDLTDLCGFREIDIKEFADSFKLSDILGDGVVDVTELPRILSRVGEAPREKELKRILGSMDPEGEGLFNFQQFIRIMTNFDRRIITEEEITEAFKIFDQDSSGSIESEELLHVLQSMGDKMTEEEANGMIAEADKDGDGEISYGEFVKTILSTS